MVSEFLYLYVEIGFNTAMLCSLRITHALRGACGVDLCQSFTDERRTVSAKLIRQSELPADMSNGSSKDIQSQSYSISRSVSRPIIAR